MMTNIAMWMSNGMMVTVTGWVSVETGLFYGWNTGTVSYFYYEWTELDGFPEATFQKPPLTCITPEEIDGDIEHYKYKAVVF